MSVKRYVNSPPSPMRTPSLGDVRLEHLQASEAVADRAMLSPAHLEQLADDLLFLGKTRTPHARREYFTAAELRTKSERDMLFGSGIGYVGLDANGMGYVGHIG